MEMLQSPVGRRGFQNAIARALKNIDRVHSGENIVFDDENKLLHKLTFGRREARDYELN